MIGICTEKPVALEVIRIMQSRTTVTSRPDGITIQLGQQEGKLAHRGAVYVGIGSAGDQVFMFRRLYNISGNRPEAAMQVMESFKATLSKARGASKY